MQLKAINWIILAWTAAALSTEPRPRRHLHEIKQIIANKLFARNEPNCTQSQPSQPETLGIRFYSIPGFSDVVIKAVPKGSIVTPPPIIEKIPPNSHIGIIGSYLGTSTLSETYNALLGVKKLVKSGILEAKKGALEKITLLKPTAQKPAKPCPHPEPISPPTVEPIGVDVNSPVVPEVVPTRYSYKQVNQDGSVTTYTSYLDLNHGVKVTENGKTLPFIINRIQKIPVQLPVPVLPEVSKIVSPLDGRFGRYPTKVFLPESSYSYKQMHHDGKLTTYTALPSMYNKNDGPVIVTGTGNIPPPPAFPLNRIEEVPSVPKASTVDIIGPMPMVFDVPAGHVIYDAPVFRRPPPAPVSSGYSYTQIRGGETATNPASGAFDVSVRSPAVFEAAPPASIFPNIPEINPFRPPLPGSTPFSYNQAYSNGRVATRFSGSGIKEQGSSFSASEPLAFGVPPDPYSFSYKQISDRAMTTYPGPSDIPEKVATGANFSRMPVSTMPLVDRFAVPVPNEFVQIPSVQSSVPQRPVKVPTASGTSRFVYKHVHSDGSVTSYSGDGSTNEKGFKNRAAKPAMPTPQGNTRVFESAIYTSPFPVNVNPNAFKPSTPVSGTYSYKQLNNGQVDYHYDIGPNEQYPYSGLASNQPFPVPPPLSVIPAKVQGCVDPDINNPMVERSTGFTQEAVPLGYSYTHPGPFLPANVEDPVMAANKIHTRIGQSHLVTRNFPYEFQNVNEDYYLDPKDYVYVPPARYDEIPPPIKPLQFPKSRFPQKKFSNRVLYENFDGFNFKDVKSNQPSTTPKPQENPTGNVYAEIGTPAQIPFNRQPILTNRNPVFNNPITEEVPIPKTPGFIEQAPLQIPLNPQPILSNRNFEYNNPMMVPEQVSIPNNSAGNGYFERAYEQVASSQSSQQNYLTNNPIVVTEKASFLFKQSNPDGSTITTRNDDRNTLSVEVGEAPKQESVQTKESPSRDDIEMMETSSPVQEQANEFSSYPSIAAEVSAEPTSVSSTVRPRRRKIKRVFKQRGDIPDDD